MEWLNIHRSTLASDAFLGCDPVQRATWLCLLAYCADQENGGKIEGAATWVDRKWQQIVRITWEEAHAKCDLWSWTGEDLVVWAYPLEKELEVKRNRINGGKGGRPAKPEKNHLVPSGLPSGLTQTEPGAPISAETERKGKEGEGKGKEGEGKGNEHNGQPAIEPGMDSKPAAIPKGAQAFIDLWNEEAAKSGLAKIQEWTEKRAKRLRALAATYKATMTESMPLAIKECHKAAWCIQNRAGVDHILVPDNFQRYLDKARTEGKEPAPEAGTRPKWVLDKIDALNKLKQAKEKEKRKFENEGRAHSAALAQKEIEAIELEIKRL